MMLETTACIFCLAGTLSTTPPTLLPYQPLPFADLSGQHLQHHLIAQEEGERGSLGFRRFSFTFYRYTGDCPGQHYQGWSDLSFLGPVGPAPYQRVKITNLSTGGYTDREYDERRSRSQPFSMRWLDQHSSKYLAVQLGVNNLTYVVTHRNAGVVDQGNFSFEVTKNDVTQQRNFTRLEDDLYCSGEQNKSSARTDISSCPEGYYIREATGFCPDGTKKRISMRKIAIPRLFINTR